ncbi:MAG: hypothetical protein P1P64_07325 [Treponemataceae bacterium]
MTKIKTVNSLIYFVPEKLLKNLLKQRVLTLCLLAFVFCVFSLNAQMEFSPELRSMVSTAFNQNDLPPEQVAKKFSASIVNLNSTSNKLQALEILASYEEANYLFADAAEHYSQAALLETNAENIFNLNIKTARAYFLSGDNHLGTYILNSVLARTTNAEIKTKAEVYLLFANLAEEININDNILILKNYIANPKYSKHQASLLFVLYWLTDDDGAKRQLLHDFPKSIEAGLVLNEVTVSPVAFWYLMPRKQKQISQEQNPSAPVKKADSEVEKTFEKPLYHQVGFFQNKTYAENLVIELVKKGFSAQIKSKTKNGVVSYCVFVNESNGTTSTAEKLKNAGYESYPVFAK